METIATDRTPTETLLNSVISILSDITADWESEFQGPIGPHTRLVGDLAFGSIDIVQLAVALEEHFGQLHLPFQQLIMTPEGRYVEDVSVEQLVAFVAQHVPARS